KALGLKPDGGQDTYRQSFDVTVKLTGEASVKIGKDAIEGAQPLSFSSTVSNFEAPLVLVNYGVDSKDLSAYKGLDVQGKIVVVRRFVPEDKAFDSSEMKRT